MNILRKLILAIIFCCVSFAAFAQRDTLIKLPKVEVNSTPLRKNTTGSTSKTLHSSDLKSSSYANIAAAIAQETGAFIKSYGLGSLATSSIRGASASHTLVLWNGLPLQSPMLGQLDLSLLPLSASESISFTKGGNSTAWGSGAIGGTIEMENRADLSSAVSIHSRTEIGAFGLLAQNYKMGFGNSKLQSVSKLSYRRSSNDFSYKPAPGLTARKQSNAALQQQNYFQDIYLKAKSKNRFSFHLWQQNSKRQIPPTNVQNSSLARQDDRATRLSAKWKNIGKTMIWHGKIGFFDEELNYYDDLIFLESLSQFNTLTGELSAQKSWQNKHLVQLGLTQLYTKVKTKNYSFNPSENRTALFGFYRFSLERLQVQTALRQELTDGQFAPFVPSVAFDFLPIKPIKIFGKISRNYRLPTFNDRYWIPGGNRDLLPESGYAAELSLQTNIKKENQQFSLLATGFHRRIDNLIIWHLKEGDNFFSSANLAATRSRGLEFRFKHSIKRKLWKIKWELGYNKIKSVSLTDSEAPRLRVGEQLIYVPVHRIFGQLLFNFKNISLNYQYQFTSATKGINESLPAYTVGNIQLNYTIKNEENNSSIFLNINNIWDADYFIIERRPMPGRWISGGLSWYFSRKQLL